MSDNFSLLITAVQEFIGKENEPSDCCFSWIIMYVSFAFCYYCAAHWLELI